MTERTWDEESEWERRWWGACHNSLGEEFKQLVYAKRMGLVAFHDGKSPFNFDLRGASVLDIGGGPCSLLLKCVNVRGTVVDPCAYPDWVAARYAAAGIEYLRMKAEDLGRDRAWDIALLYNVLQHVEDPAKILSNVRAVTREVRIFEWIDEGVSVGHPQNLTEPWLNAQLGGEGKVEQINERTAVGKAFFGIFKGERYA